MCIVIAVLNGIEISRKLFTPEMVVPALSIHDYESVLGMYRSKIQYRCGLANRRTSGQLSFEGSWILLLNNNSRELVPITDCSDNK